MGELMSGGLEGRFVTGRQPTPSDRIAWSAKLEGGVRRRSTEFDGGPLTRR
jgi:hypothetical protein